MLAKAIERIGLGDRCLIDAGDPHADYLPIGSRRLAMGVSLLWVVGGSAAIPPEWMDLLRGDAPYGGFSGEDRWATQAAVAAAIVGFARNPHADPDTRDAARDAQRFNLDCSQGAVLAKLHVVEDRAAANMLAEALRALSPNDAKCLVDAGNPATQKAPTSAARSQIAQARTVYVIGGSEALSDDWLTRYFGRIDSQRVAGPDRWVTQAVVANLIVQLAQGKGGRVSDWHPDHVRGDPTGHLLPSETDDPPPHDPNLPELAAGVRNAAVHVFYGGPTGSYSMSQLEAEARSLDDIVEGFYAAQFGDSDYLLTFSAGRILSPNLDWAIQSLGEWLDDPESRGCHDALVEEIESSNGAFSHRTALIVADAAPSGQVAGFAGLSAGPAVVAARTRFSTEVGYYSTVAHELGHSLNGFRHPHNDACGGTTSAEELWSIMSYGRCGGIDDVVGMTAYVMCSKRELLGWAPKGLCNGRRD